MEMRVIDMGHIFENEVRSFMIPIDNVPKRVAACGCIRSEYYTKNSLLKITYTGETIPFHIQSDVMQISKTIKIAYEDKEEAIKLDIKLVRNDK